MRSIAIIPARSGSKGLPDKNIKLFRGKPLMAWTIEAAINSGVFDKVFVSTDSDLYKKIAEEYGAIVPFYRSSDNSSDTANSWDVVREVLIKCEQILDWKFDVFCLLQPTSPLRTSEDIKAAMGLFEQKGADSIVSVCEAEHSLSLYNTLDNLHSMKDFLKGHEKERRQDSQTFYRINGAIYIQKTCDVMENISIYGDKSYAYIMEKKNSVDIDDEYDFAVAEALFNI